MKLANYYFRGELPILGNSKLPEGYATEAMNTRLLSGDIQGYYDFGNYFTLAKAAPILTVEKLAANGDWLQFTYAELGTGMFDIRAVPGTIPGDTTGRMYITGYNAESTVINPSSLAPFSGPQFTNTFWATDPSNQGGNVADALPYQTFKLGIDDPTDASTPLVSVPANSAVVTEWDAAAETTVNSAGIDAGGQNYAVGDVITPTTGTILTGLTGCYLEVLEVSTVGTATGVVSKIGLQKGGFYTLNNGPTNGTATSNVSGSMAGTGLTLNNIIAQNNAYPFSNQGWGNYQYQPGGGSGAYSYWSVNSGAQWQLQWAQVPLGVAYSVTAYNLIGATSVLFQADVEAASGTGNGDIILYLSGVYNGFNQNTGPAVVLSTDDATFAIYDSLTVSGSGGGITNPSVAFTAWTGAFNTKYRISVEMVAQDTGTQAGFLVTATLATVAAPGTAIATVSAFVPYVGEQLGLGGNHRGTFGDVAVVTFENVLVQVTSPPPQATVESTNYVYTYVQQIPSDILTQGSGPSDPSATVDVYIDGTTTPPTRTPVTITIPPAPVGEFILYYNLYRLVEDSSGNETYTFVTQLAASTTNPVVYVDSAQDDGIGPDTLISTDWAPPPVNMQGILALPNGIMCGFFDNVLCLSAQNYPHAWPVDNQYATDTSITGTAAIDTEVLILTQAYPYTAFGTDPSAFNMSKEVSIQGCVATRSIATHKIYGVIFASGNGLCYYKGSGALDLIRIGPTNQPPYSYEQWQAFNPESVEGVLHDDYYWFWFVDESGNKQCRVLDLTPTGFGLIRTDFHVTEAYVDKLTDTLYVTPDFSIYPIDGAPIAAASNVLCEWEAAATMRERVWARYDNLLPRPAAFRRARTRYEPGSSSDTVALLCGSEIGTAYNAAVTKQNSFTIAPANGIRWFYQLTMTGEVSVQSQELAEATTELLGA